MSIMDTKSGGEHRKSVLLYCFIVIAILANSTGEKLWGRYESVVTDNALTTASTKPGMSDSLRTAAIIAKIARQICTGNNFIPILFDVPKENTVKGPCGQIQSPIVPLHQSIITWELSVPPQLSLNLTFTTFTLLYSVYECQRDWAQAKQIVFGMEIVLWRKCGERLPWSSLTNVNSIVIEFGTWTGDSYFSCLFQIYDTNSIVGNMEATTLINPDGHDI